MQPSKRRKLKVVLAWAFWATNLVIIVGFWANGHLDSLGIDTGETLVAVARLSGLLATFCVLTQLVVMGRQGWLEPVFGLDKLAIFHRRNGVVALCLILLHPVLMVAGYSAKSGLNPIVQYFSLWASPLFVLASLGVVLFVTTVGTSIYIVRKHLKFEWWYLVHLFNYVAVLLVVWHQLAFGITGGPFAVYWISLYVFAFATIVMWRWILPVVQSRSHDFRVEKTVSETPTATSVYIAGRSLEHFTVKGGQFVLVRFMAKGFWWEEHPFSVSQLPNGQHFRLTIRQLGDFTNKIPQLKPGTRVIVSGPHGAFTHERQVKPKVLYIAGGIGITPIVSMIQERAGWQKPGDAVLIYGNRTVGDSTLLAELKAYAAKIKMPIHNVLSEQKDYKGEKGYVDGEKIKRLVPDVAQRDVYLCGPPPMMAGIVASLKQMGVPGSQVHYERFSLHK